MNKAKHKEKTSHSDEFFDRLAAATKPAADQPAWMGGEDYEGQLAVDVYQNEQDIIIRAAIAGVKAEEIDITVNNDMVTIKGLRHLDEEVPDGNYLYQECYWGGFSRSIILPVEVRAEKVQANLKNGILRVVLPKMDRPRAAPIRVVDEDLEDET